LSNALKHSQAATIDVELGARDGRITLVIADDGTGFDPADAQRRSTKLGITSMEERAEALGGQLRIDSGEGGTRVILEAPVG
jgi:signal transduction histidine kinase